MHLSILATFVLLLANTCNQCSKYPVEATLDTSGLLVSISEHGANKIAAASKDVIQGVLRGINIPDVSRYIEFKGIGLNIAVSNMHFTDFTIADTSVSYRDDGASFSFNGAEIALSFHYWGKQTGFPWLSDSGSGDVRLTGIEGSIDGSVGLSSDCPNHLSVSINKYTIDMLDKPHIYMDSTLSKIYLPIILALVPQVKDVLINLLRNNFQKLLDQANVMASALQDYAPEFYSMSVSDNKFIMDLRFTTGVLTTDGVATIAYPALTYYNEDVEKFLVFPVSKVTLPRKVNDDDVQFIMTASAFNSALKTFSDQQSSYSASLFDGECLETLVNAIGGLSEYAAGKPITARIQYDEAPQVVKITEQGLIVSSNVALFLFVNGSEIGYFSIKFVSNAHPGTYTVTPWTGVEMTSFILKLEKDSSITEMSYTDVASVKLDYSNVQDALIQVFDEWYAPLFSGAMGKRSFFFGETVTMLRNSPTVKYFPPNYMALTYNI